MTDSESGGSTNIIVKTDNNDNINADKSSIGKNSVINTNIGTDTSGSVSINKNNSKNDKPKVSKPNSAQIKAGTSNINANKAKFEEDIKKEPILQTILDMFDGELL